MFLGVLEFFGGHGAGIQSSVNISAKGQHARLGGFGCERWRKILKALIIQRRDFLANPHELFDIFGFLLLELAQQNFPMLPQRRFGLGGRGIIRLKILCFCRVCASRPPVPLVPLFPLVPLVPSILSRRPARDLVGPATLWDPVGPWVIF